MLFILNSHVIFSQIQPSQDYISVKLNTSFYITHNQSYEDMAIINK